MLWEVAVAYDSLGTGNGHVASGFDKGSGVISSLGSVAGHTYERAAQPISIEDRAECRIGGSFLADDFKKLSEFS